MNTATTILPAWADVRDCEDDVSFWETDAENTHLSIFTDDLLRSRVLVHYARLFVDQKFVAGAKMLGPGNFSMQAGTVLCYVEVHRDYRGRKLSATLMQEVQKHLGVVHRTGTFSMAGAANAKYLDLPLVPGGKMYTSETVEYNFINWDWATFE